MRHGRRSQRHSGGSLIQREQEGRDPGREVKRGGWGGREELTGTSDVKEKCNKDESVREIRPRNSRKEETR